MNSLAELTDNQLIEVFCEATKRCLEEEFLQILRNELKRRGIEVTKIS